MIDNKVKLVIWDLDETFWRGTLSEEGIIPVPRNAEMVVALCKRGIISSICSKNDLAQAKAKLIELGVWDFFVFPVINFAPKGKAVAEMIENAGLRAENVLFIDDNTMNLEEVKFFNKGIMTGHPDEVLDTLLDHPNLAGKPDPELTRLKQYQFLQRKVEERGSSTLSNEEFLRTSNIRLNIDYDIDKNFDRVVELINRTNQLNYTKVRLETPEALEQFREQLNGFGAHAGCIRAADNYGDYGLIGFFLMKRMAGVKKMIHFVFSCRAMNMGIEQYVYEMLGKPDIEIVRPVTEELDVHKSIDWISLGDAGDSSGVKAPALKLVLLGGCDLLQLASYCSTERTEFVNRVQDGQRVRYDDPGFILTDRETIRDCVPLRRIACWSYEDALAFDAAVASSEINLISLWPSFSGEYLRIDNTLTIRLTRQQLERFKKKKKNWFAKYAVPLDLSREERLELVRASLERIAERAPASSKIFAMGTYSLGPITRAQAERRDVYNSWCRTFCATRPDRFTYIDVDAIVPRDSLVDEVHFNRSGYFALARHILALMPESGEALKAAQ